MEAKSGYDTLNGTAGLAILMVRGGNDLTVGLTGVAGFVVLLLVNILIAWLDPEFDLEVVAEEPVGAY